MIDPRRVYEHYDQLVGSRTVRRPGLDAAVLRLTPSYRGLAVSLDGPPLGIRDPFRAGARAMLEARSQRRLRRRRATRPHRLPELRQPREAGDRLGAGSGDRGHRPGGRGARHPRRLRQRVALQRDRRPPDPAHAGRRLCRARGGRPAGAARLAAGATSCSRRRRNRSRPAGRGRRSSVPLESRTSTARSSTTFRTWAPTVPSNRRLAGAASARTCRFPRTRRRSSRARPTMLTSCRAWS